MEVLYTDMTVMLNELEIAIKNVVKGPYAFWGHSMGGKIAYELEKRMEKDGKLAQCVFISGSRIPSVPEPKPIHHLSDAVFKKELARFEGTAKEVLRNQKLLDFFLPILRADFMMDETYYDDEVARLRAPIVAIGGEQGSEANVEMIREWRKYTSARFAYKIFEAGHFFIRDREDDVIKYVMESLKNMSNTI